MSNRKDQRERKFEVQKIFRMRGAANGLSEVIKEILSVEDLMTPGEMIELIEYAEEIAAAIA